MCEKCLAQLQEDYNEPTAVITSEVTGAATQAYTEASTAAILGLLDELPNGMLAYFDKFKIAMTSLNLGVLKTEDTLWLQTNVRSNDNNSRQELKAQLKAIGEKYGCTYSVSGDYPAWEYSECSPLRDTLMRVRKQLHGFEPTICVTHAGLECGIIGKQLPGVDSVSTGTNMLFIHTADEKLEIEPFGRFLEYFKAVLKEL